MQDMINKNAKEKLVREMKNSILIKLLNEGMLTEKQYKVLIK